MPKNVLKSTSGVREIDVGPVMLIWFIEEEPVSNYFFLVVFLAEFYFAESERRCKTDLVQFFKGRF